MVVGVHSPKFPTERLTPGLRQAVRRLGIRHPVVNDRDFQVWRAYAVSAWPTLVLIDPQGRIIGQHRGEFPYDAFERLIANAVAHFQERGLLDPRPLHFQEAPGPQGPLAFPGKVLAHAPRNRLFVADSGHHRLLECTLEGEVVRVIGAGAPGLEDGPPGEARFRNPQGMALVGDHLFVADADNHALRRVDLPSGRVETVAGTGEQAPPEQGGGPARETPLNSPWDLVAVGGAIYIAMAGCHQIWALDLEWGRLFPFAGTGQEGLVDGPLAEALLAQPSGITSDGESLFFADSEASAVRRADLDLRGGVHTLVGKGLFDYGDRDGTGEGVRLQHPLGVCYAEGLLLVADTYNHKVKRLHPSTRACTTWLGSGQPSLADGRGREACFNEPGGLSIAGDRLYIADTNNHAVRVAHLATGEVATLALRGLA